MSRFLQKSKSVVLGQKTPTKRHESVTRLEAGSPAVASDLAQHDTETQSFLLLETFSSFERNHPALFAQSAAFRSHVADFAEGGAPGIDSAFCASFRRDTLGHAGPA
ncbi:hypothetical protein [Thiolapillus sp.]|uniref:hypothetical protein n=1 Tax=Thiolapillus sp. TaxID=2017437 RepID=UPI0025CE9384